MRLGVGLSVVVFCTQAGAQSREPLCVTVDARRLVSGPYLQANGSDRVVALPLPWSDCEVQRRAAFVVAARDPDHTLRGTDARGRPRALEELGYTGEFREDRPSGLTVVRMDRDLGVVGDGVWLPDPVRGPRGVETWPPGIPAGATVRAGVLVVEVLAGDLYATVVGPTGSVPDVVRVAEAPMPERAGTARGYVWLTVGAYGDGAAVLAGTDDGQVVALGMDGDGRVTGGPRYWSVRVGGPMAWVPVAAGVSPVAALDRPVQGTTVAGGQAREVVLVRLGPTLEPLGEPERLGLGPYETAMATRGVDTVLAQWAEARGLALSTLRPQDGNLQVDVPQIRTTQPFEGVPLGHALVGGGGEVLWDLMLHGDPTAGGLHGYVTWIPPTGTPVVRRDVLPLRARVIAPPGLLAADDGFVAVLAAYDEAGGGLDAVHVHCEMVTLPR